MNTPYNQSRLTHESGQTLVVAVLFIAALMGFAALLIDGGTYFVQRRDMQGDVDAAALAAVRELPGNPGMASSVATSYVEDYNKQDAGQLASVAYSQGNTRVDVRVRTEGRTSFAALLGVDKPEIGARAVARVQMMGPTKGMLPFAFMRDTFKLGTNYEVKFAHQRTATNTTGNRGVIAPLMGTNCTAPTGADDMANLIRGERHGGTDACAVPLGDPVMTEPGGKTGKIDAGLNDRIGLGGKNSEMFDDVFGTDPTTGLNTIELPDSPRIGIVPVVERTSDGMNEWPTGRSEPVTILTYMLVYIGKTDAPGSPAYTDGGKSVWVTPIRPMLPNEFPGIEGFVDYDEDLPAPVVYRLVE